MCPTGGCGPVGWLDDETALLRTDPHGILAWNVVTGDLALVTAPFAGLVSVSP